MAASYKKLFKLLIDRDIKKKELKESSGISYSTLWKLEAGENVQMDVLERICRAMNCTLDDIVEFVDAESDKEPEANIPEGKQKQG